MKILPPLREKGVNNRQNMDVKLKRGQEMDELLTRGSAKPCQE